MSRLFENIRKHAIWIVILIGVLPFFITINNGFLSDGWEFLHIAETQPFTLERMLLTNTQGFVGPSSYRPMVNIYWGVMYQLFGLAGHWYHLTILTLYAGSVYLLYATLKRTTWLGEYRSTLAIVAAAVFAWNPVRVSSLAWVSIVNDTMLVFFVLLSWYLFTRFLHEEKKRWYWYVASLIAGLFAIGSKEVGVTVPIVIGAMSLLHQLQYGVRCKQMLKSLAIATLHAVPFLLLIAVYMLLRQYATGFITEDYTGSAFVWFDGYTVRSYVSMFVSFFLVDPIRTSVTAWLYPVAGWVAVITLYFFGVWRHIQKHVVDRYIGGALFVLLLLMMYPVSRFGVNFLSFYTSSEGERYAYYPSIFFSLAFVWFFRNKIIQLKAYKMAVVALIGIAALYSIWMVMPRIVHWEQASHIAETLVHNTIQRLQDTTHDEVLFIGLPDMYHGAYVWRNGFVLRLTTFEDIPYTANQLQYTDTRTLLQDGTQLAVGNDAGTITYYTTDGAETIVGPTNGVQYGYEGVMPQYRFELLSITHTNFASSTVFTPTHNEDDTDRAVFLFDGIDDWIVYEQ